MSLLFSFKKRLGGDLSDDDDLDSDYHPGKNSDEDDEEILRRKRILLKGRKRKQEKTSTKTSESRYKLRRTEQGTDSDVSSRSKYEGFQYRLPPEVLIKIFQYGIAAEGFTRFIPRVAQVCKEWNLVASDPSVAHRLDLSASRGTLSRKTQNMLMNFLKRDVSQCHQLSLHGQINLGVSVIEHVLKLVPRLRTLDLCGCALKHSYIESLPQLCPLIQSLDLSSLGANNCNHRNSNVPAVLSMIEGLGPNLVELRLTDLLVVMLQASSLLEVIQDTCPKLEELNLGIAGISSKCRVNLVIDMAALARGCPRLRELYLDGFFLSSMSLTQNPDDSSLKNLQIYSQACSKQRDVDDSVLFSLFSSVKRLKMLNISNSMFLPSLITHWVQKVEEAYLQSMKWTEIDQHEMITCVEAWSTSLRLLDISYCKPCNGIIHLALSKFERGAEYPLEVLNLSNANVTPCSIIHMIKTCKNLKEINLTSCRELPRGTKREFKREEFESLLKSLEKIGVEDGVSE